MGTAPITNINNPSQVVPLHRGVVINNLHNETRKAKVLPALEEEFLDSKYNRNWMGFEEASELFEHLKHLGEERLMQLENENPLKKYPLVCRYYGFRREYDGALALDRWGSDYESWLRVEEPTHLLEKCCQRLRFQLNKSDEAINSILVNYYFDGDSMYIPAHRDTVNSLEDGSSINVLSLGATRSFVICDNNDAGKFLKQDLHIAKEWSVSQGDLYSLGPQTNASYCHCVPREPGVSTLRIAVIMRTVTKSFIQYSTVPKTVVYADGTTRTFNASCISSRNYADTGVHEHISDLIDRREKRKMSEHQIHETRNAVTIGAELNFQSNYFHSNDEMKKFYLGEAETTRLAIS